MGLARPASRGVLLKAGRAAGSLLRVLNGENSPQSFVAWPQACARPATQERGGKRLAGSAVPGSSACLKFDRAIGLVGFLGVSGLRSALGSRCRLHFKSTFGHFEFLCSVATAHDAVTTHTQRSPMALAVMESTVERFRSRRCGRSCRPYLIDQFLEVKSDLNAPRSVATFSAGVGHLRDQSDPFQPLVPEMSFDRDLNRLRVYARRLLAPHTCFACAGSRAKGEQSYGSFSRDPDHLRIDNGRRSRSPPDQAQRRRASYL
jgi:hypothetical protein